MLIAEIIVLTVSIYLLIGIVFSVYFVIARIAKFDESAKGAGFGFKVIIFFGVIPFWAFIFWRMIRGSDAPIERNSHRDSAELEND